MLRISEIETTDHRRRLRLEGRLVDEWISLLRQLIGDTDLSSLCLDLAELSSASTEGVELLRQLRSNGTIFDGCPPYLRHLCDCQDD